MSSRSTKLGSCALCGHGASKAKLVAHLATCVAAHDKPGPAQSLLLLHIEAVRDARYWLLVEARGNATLAQLDAFLRDIWVECCGHLSAFVVDRREIVMRATAAATFGLPGSEFEYEYDFGSTTALAGQVLSTRQGSIGRTPLRLLARNDSLRESCAECAELATLVCPYCIDAEEKYLFCDTHARGHEHADEDAYLPVVNSPRMGVCGYTG
jgi:hypothetical protein